MFFPNSQSRRTFLFYSEKLHFSINTENWPKRENKWGEGRMNVIRSFQTAGTLSTGLRGKASAGAALPAQPCSSQWAQTKGSSKLPEGQTERKESGLPKRLPEHSGHCCCPMSLLPKTLCALEAGPRDHWAWTDLKTPLLELAFVVPESITQVSNEEGQPTVLPRFDAQDQHQ